jgi:hypothetical protein
MKTTIQGRVTNEMFLLHNSIRNTNASNNLFVIEKKLLADAQDKITESIIESIIEPIIFKC